MVAGVPGAVFAISAEEIRTLDVYSAGVVNVFPPSCDGQRLLCALLFTVIATTKDASVGLGKKSVTVAPSIAPVDLCHVHPPSPDRRSVPSGVVFASTVPSGATW